MFFFSLPHTEAAQPEVEVDQTEAGVGQPQEPVAPIEEGVTVGVQDQGQMQELDDAFVYRI